MSEPIQISEAARNAARLLVYNWRSPFGNARYRDHERQIQLAIDFALAEKDKEIAEKDNEIEKLKKKNQFTQARINILARYTASAKTIRQAELDDEIHNLNILEEESKVYQDQHIGLLEEEIVQLEKQVLALRETLSTALYKIESANFLLGESWAVVDEIKASLNSIPTDLSKKFVKREALAKSLPIVEFVVARNPNWIEATGVFVAIRKELES